MYTHIHMKSSNITYFSQGLWHALAVNHQYLLRPLGHLEPETVDTVGHRRTPSDTVAITEPYPEKGDFPVGEYVHLNSYIYMYIHI